MQLTPTTGHIPAKRAENVLVLRTPAPAIVGMLEFRFVLDGAPIEITKAALVLQVGWRHWHRA